MAMLRQWWASPYAASPLRLGTTVYLAKVRGLPVPGRALVSPKKI